LVISSTTSTSRANSIEDNRTSCEGLVELTLEGKGKGTGVGLVSPVDTMVVLEEKVLGVVSWLVSDILAVIHDIIAIRTHALGAINISPLGIADATTGLLFVPVVVVKLVSLLNEVGGAIRGGFVEGGGSELHVLDVLALAVTGAIIRASGTLASLTLVSGEALARASVAIADTLGGTLSVLVVLAERIGGINPGEFEGADALGAITRIIRETKTPVVVTSTDTVEAAGTVTRALVIAASDGSSDNSREDYKLKHFYKTKSVVWKNGKIKC
jgi:hypothetical protein